MSTGTADLFDLDDLLSDVAVTEIDKIDKEEKEEKEEAEPEPPKINRLRSRCPDNVLFFDLETIPDYPREPLFDLPALPEIIQPAPETADADMMPPAEWVTQDVAAAKQTVSNRNPSFAWIDAARAAEIAKPKGGSRKGIFDILDGLVEMKNIATKSATVREEARAAQRKTMAVTPEFCRIVSFAWAMGDDSTQASAFRANGGTTDHDTYEKAVLLKFWELAKRAKLIVGFNHLHFDLPVIYVRSAMLGVVPTRAIDLKPWGGECVDVMAGRWPKGGAKRLKDIARILGFPIPAGDVDGSQVEELFNTDPAKLADYNRSDVSITREIYLMYRGLFW